MQNLIRPRRIPGFGFEGIFGLGCGQGLPQEVDMEGEIAKLTQFGQVVTLYGRQMLAGLLILVAGLILTRIIIKHLLSVLK